MTASSRACAVLVPCAGLALGLCTGVAAYAASPEEDAFVGCAVRSVTSFDQAAAIPRLLLPGIVDSAEVVALGEPAHGNHEPLQARNQIMQYLVEKLGFTAVVLETSFVESEPISRFVDGRTTLQTPSVSRDNLSWGFGEFAENEELIRWLHDYNADPAHARKVHFYGMDLSGSDHHGSSFAAARAGVDHALGILQRVETIEARRLRAALEPLLEHLSGKKIRTTVKQRR